MRRYAWCALLVVLSTVAWAQGERPDAGPAYTLRFVPTAPRDAHYQGIFHGTVRISKFPGLWELNGKMHLREEVLANEQGGLCTQRFTFVDASFRFGGYTMGFDLKGETLLLKRGADLVATELVSEPPEASVVSGDVLGVISSLPWAIGFPRDPIHIGDQWAKRFSPAPPDIGQPIGPETYRPRVLETRNRLLAVENRGGRPVAVLSTRIDITEKENGRNHVLIEGPAGYWLDNGELAFFDGQLTLFVAVDVAGHIVEIELRDAIIQFEERPLEQVSIALPPRGPKALEFISDAGELHLKSYPLEPRTLEKLGLSVPPDGKPYVQDDVRISELKCASLPPMSTDADRAAVAASVREALSKTLFYAYRIPHELGKLADWARGLQGAHVEQITGAKGFRIQLDAAPKLWVALAELCVDDQRYLVVTDSPELAATVGKMIAPARQ